jgi:hypothetical protein
VPGIRIKNPRNPEFPFLPESADTSLFVSEKLQVTNKQMKKKWEMISDQSMESISMLSPLLSADVYQ